MSANDEMAAKIVAALPEEMTQEILKRLKEDVPSPLDIEAYKFLGQEDIDFTRYTAPEFFQKEMDQMWSKVWQWACREEHIPNPGDHMVYEVGPYSLIITRTDTGDIKAFFNSCLHRGTKLCASESAGSKMDFRCPYHGWTWNLDGSLKDIPSSWDFSHVDPAEFGLEEAQVGLWGGFVFINMDPDAPPLADYMGVLPEHFDNWNMADRYVVLHVQKELDCNWKAAVEAFMENYHTRETHPQLLASTNEPSTQYDIFDDHVSRFYALMGIPSPHLDREMSEQDLIDNMLTGDRETVDGALKVPEGSTARATMAAFLRDQFDHEYDVSTEGLADCEIVDTIEYTLFPNMVLFPGLSLPMIYRFRPIGMDPGKALFDLLFLRPVPRSGERPEPALPVRIGVEDSYTIVPGMDPGMAHVYDQDTGNLALQQEGFLTSRKKGQTLGNYQEVRIRHLHQTLDKYVG
jgi:phenylpropionate dioxygenase-like ring-hydroxylating dioxygenase large terminal subunit